MKILMWNVRGANGLGRALMIRGRIQEAKPDIVCLVEHKVKSKNLTRFKNAIWTNAWAANDMVVDSGRILVLWNEEVVDLKVTFESPQMLHFKGLWRQEGTDFELTAIYGENGHIDRRKMWEDLKMVEPHNLKPWIVGGDFNCIRWPNEKCGGSGMNEIAAKEFNECIDNLQLLEMAATGAPFTWTNSSEGEARIDTRIDRILMNHAWLQEFPEAYYVVGERDLSDHAMMTMTTEGEVKRKRKMFKFENHWTDHEEFLGIVKEAWKTWVAGTPMYRMIAKQHEVKKALKKWSANKFGNIVHKVGEATSHLANVRRRKEEVPADASLVREEEVAKEDLNRILAREESIIRQKSRVKWLKEGDRNTRFFHAHLRVRRATNKVRRVCEGATIIEEEGEIRERFRNFFANLFANDFQVVPIKHTVILPQVTHLEGERLIRKLDVKELEHVVLHANVDKAPGPDGFNAKFFKVAWEVIKKDMVKAVESCINNGRMLKQWNYTSITLIAKKRAPETVEDYRPIALCNMVYRFTSKILANRLKEVLPRLVGVHQSAFVQGRRISDNILLAHELCHNLHLERGRGRMCIKLDIRKAYDSISWSFLEGVMERFGLPRKWRRLILACVEASFVVTVNGANSAPFMGRNGLRQGDPLASYLFVMCMEVLSEMVKEAIGNGKVEPIKYGACVVSHLMFADDVLLFATATKDCARGIK